MDEENVELSISKNSLDKKSEELVLEIIDEQDSEKLKNLIDLFNLNQNKKNIVRIDIFSKLLDKISIQMVERFSKKPGEFSNKDLLEYLSAIKVIMDKTNLQPENINIPIIQNNTQVNLNVDNLLNRDSRERVADAVKSILSNIESNKKIIDICDNIEETDE